MDSVLLWCVLILVVFGIVMVFSSSSIYASEKLGDDYHFLKKQLVIALLGITLMVAAALANYQLWSKLVLPILIGSFLSLILVLVPGVGNEVSGSSRWLKFAGFSLQPAEFAKLALIIYLAYSLSKKQQNIRFLPKAVVSGVFISLIIAQPDFGTAMILAAIVLALLFAAGLKLRHLLSGVLLSLPAIYLLIIRADYRKKRILAFLNPWKDPTNSGFQIIQSFLAFGSGGLWGMGLGRGRQKLFYLPDAHTDFIFSVIGEELGFLGVVVVLTLFLIVVLRGIKISLNAPDLFGSYLALGITLMIGLQAVVNIGVSIGLLPTKGLTLPFISYGGSSLLVSLIGAGILLNISSRRASKTRKL
ncbi:MAG: putative lipid II flippase FtsW [Deltaproteobacteria bacterium]|nr:MAG: putative lipid II flippase FtsW [Deltaproteobacteria bacterium]